MFGNDLAKRMVWEADLAKNTNPKNFARYIEWRREELNRRTTPRKKNFFSVVRELLSAKKKNNIVICGCTFGRSSAMYMSGIVFYVCEEHAREFGIHAGPYWEEEVLTLKFNTRSSEEPSVGIRKLFKAKDGEQALAYLEIFLMPIIISLGIAMARFVTKREDDK